MREKDVHNLIEQQDPEAKQRLWEKISAQLDLAPQPEAQTKAQVKPKLKGWHWTTIAVALVCIVTLSIVLPLTLKDNGTRYCDSTQYTTDILGQTLREYSLAHNSKYLYVDWYNNAEEIVTKYGYINDKNDDIVFFEEFIINGDTGDTITLSITDKNTKVDRFNSFYEESEELVINGVTVKWRDNNKAETLATFEYNGYIYYLQLNVGEAKDQITEIIEGMLK